MNSNKIEWIYAGLGIAAGVGLVMAMRASSDLEAKELPFIGPNDRVLLIGDSLAEGLSFPLKQLAYGAGIPFAADARRGTKISQWAKSPWLSSALTSFRPTVTLISLGTNDMMLADPASEANDLAALVQMIGAASSRIIFIAPPTMPFVEANMFTVRSMIASQKKPVFPSELLQIPRAKDQIHSTPAGYAGWAGSLWKWLYPASNGVGKLPTRNVVRRKVVRSR